MAVAAKMRRSSGSTRSDAIESTALETRTSRATVRPPMTKPPAPEPVPAAAAADPGGTDTHDIMATKIGTRIDPASMIFDGDWYKQQYPDVAAAKLDPVRHYFDDGFREGRNPNRYFDTVWYANSNPDVAAARLNPFLHYLLYGAVEGRKPAP